MAQAAPAAQASGGKQQISLLGAIFIGIGSMVGAGIFALFGQAGTIAGADARCQQRAAALVHRPDQQIALG